jgi:small redox-active disulfide protein 2
MKNIKVFGTGCANCKATVNLINQVAERENIAINIEKIEDIQKIMQAGVMSTPAVMVDQQMVHAGGIPSADAIATWLK